jgi:integrase/recombinase XerD
MLSVGPNASKHGRSASSKGRKLPKTITRESAAKLLAKPNTHCPTGLRNRCILELMYRAGLRVSDICGIHVRDVNWDTGRIRIRPEVAKGGREAVVFAEPAVLEWLDRWKITRRPYAAPTKTPELFVTLHGAPVDRHYIFRMVKRYAERAGIGWVGPHMLRHTFASELIEEGFTVVEVQERLRHANLSTTSIYLHLANPGVEEKIAHRDRSYLA